jgi:hypothetical protein
MPGPRQRRPAPRPRAGAARRPIVAIAAASVAAFVPAFGLGGTARGEEGERAFTAGAVDLLLADSGEASQLVFATAGRRLALSDTWEVAGEVRAGARVGPGGPDAAGGAAADVRYVIDALTFVPLLLAGTGVTAWGAGPDLAWTLHAGAGLDWRPRRTWSIGLALRYHAAVLGPAGASLPFEAAVTVSFFDD